MAANRIHVNQNLVGRTYPYRVHAPDWPDSDYYLCRPQGRKGQYGSPTSRCRTSEPVTCKACLRHPVLAYRSCTTEQLRVALTQVRNGKRLDAIRKVLRERGEG